MSERYGPKDAERQMAWLAKALGIKVQYLYLSGEGPEDWSQMAEPGQRGEEGTWYLHHAGAGQGYNVAAYSGPDSGICHPLGERLHSCKDLWHALYMARMALGVDRGSFV